MTHRTLSITRAVGVIGSVGALVVGATFASLSSTVTLSGNTISSATASLQLQTVAQPTPGPVLTGFNLTNVMPGVGTAPFYFNIINNGAVPLSITAHVPTVPTYSGFLDGGFSGVHIKLTKFNDNSVVYADTTLAALLAGEVALANGPLAGGAQAQLKAVVIIDPAVVTGSHAQVDAFDIVMTGTQPVAP